jgi:hypothetical protein
MMIKFKAASSSGREILGFGLTEQNIQQLKKGNPVFVMGPEMGLPFDVTIIYGKDEQTMAADLRKAGLIDPEKTVIHDTGKKPRQ